MRKLLTCTFALILAFSLAACGDKNGGGFGDITLPGGSSSPDDSTGGGDSQAYTPGQSQPSLQTDNNLVGWWGSGPFTPKENTNIWVEFRADGTFTDYAANIGIDVDEGEFWATGNYRAENGKIYCTNVKRTYQSKTGSHSEDFTDRPDEDFVWFYEFTYGEWPKTLNEKYTNLLCLILNIEGPEQDYALTYYKPYEE